MTENLLEVEGLSKKFGQHIIIDNISLNVMKGDIYGFLGRNGSGKTTTIRLITGLIYPDTGAININGYSLRTNFKMAISQIGAIVETPAFYSYLSGYENLSLMANLIPGFKKSQIDELLEIVGLREWSKNKYKTYSLGMKQRLGLANALLGDPKLVILDEPTNGLDPQGMKEMKETIVQLSLEKGITFFISSHLLHEVEQICNRVGIIKNGKMLAEGNLKELAGSQPNSLEKYYFEVAGE